MDAWTYICTQVYIYMCMHGERDKCWYSVLLSNRLGNFLLPMHITIGVSGHLLDSVSCRAMLNPSEVRGQLKFGCRERFMFRFVFSP